MTPPPEIQVIGLLTRILDERTPEETTAILHELLVEVSGQPMALWLQSWLVNWVGILGPAEAAGYTWTAEDCDEWIEANHGECNRTVVTRSEFGRVRAYATDNGLIGWQEFPGAEGSDRWALMTKKQTKQVTKSEALVSVPDSDVPF